ncbi:MAG: hypothetical protein U9Q33_02710 [Campylobacterota bacterium]|nr:hypothetical protein [Campylobacterota bacterium]
MKKAFNPDDFFKKVTVKDVVGKFPQLEIYDFSHVSLNEKLIALNYEIISKEYKDKEYANIQLYYDLEVDEVV